MRSPLLDIDENALDVAQALIRPAHSNAAPVVQAAAPIAAYGFVPLVCDGKIVTNDMIHDLRDESGD